MLKNRFSSFSDKQREEEREQMLPAPSILRDCWPRSRSVGGEQSAPPPPLSLRAILRLFDEASRAEESSILGPSVDGSRSGERIGMTQAASQSITGLKSLAAGIQFAPQLLCFARSGSSSRSGILNEQPRTSLGATTTRRMGAAVWSLIYIYLL